MTIATIRAAITSKGIRQNWLAEQIGVHPTTLNRYLTGKTAISKPALILLAQKLDLEIDPSKAS